MNGTKEPGTDFESRWSQLYEQLSPERQAMLDGWWTMQDLIMDCLGLEEDEWYELLTWALENPTDLAHVEAHPASGAVDRSLAIQRRRTQRAIGESSGIRTGAIDEHGGIRKKADGNELDKELFRNLMSRGVRR